MGVLALGGIGHDRGPAARPRGARREPRLVHVAVRRVGLQRARRLALLVPVVPEPQVVPQLMREDLAAAGEDGDGENAGEEGTATTADLGAGDQVHQVGPNPIAQAVHLVQVAVRRVCETDDVDQGFVRLPVPDLGPRHQPQAVSDPALREGLVGLGDHQVDDRRDGRGAARRRARGRRMDDGHVEGDVRAGVARLRVELDRRVAVEPAGRRAGPGGEEVRALETRQPLRGRERSREAPVVRQRQPLEARQPAQHVRDGPGQVVPAERQRSEARQVPQLARNRARQRVCTETQEPEARQVPQPRRHRPGQVVPAERQRQEIDQAAQLARNRARQRVDDRFPRRHVQPPARARGGRLENGLRPPEPRREAEFYRARAPRVGAGDRDWTTGATRGTKSRGTEPRGERAAGTPIA